ncbi:NuoI/complex I 23 kDa subunit family protein [Pseudomonadota bacterium]
MKKLRDFTLFNRLKNLLKPVNSIIYPLQKKPISINFKAEPMLRFNSDGTEKCNGCKKCEKICPVNAIKIEIKTEKKRKAVTNFTIDLNRCIFCGLCEEICPKETLVFGPNFEYAKFNKEELIYTKERLLQNGERWEYSARQRFENKKVEE